MIRVRLGSYLRHYIENRHYFRPLIAGIVIGILSGVFFGYLLYGALAPGPIITIALIFLSVVFGLVAAAISAFVFFYLQIYRMTKYAGSRCPNCGEELPENAQFCPFCGMKTDL